MNYSQRQQRIFDFIKRDRDSGEVQACAGSGKSFTIKHSLPFTQMGMSIFIGAFNTHIANPLSKEVIEFVPIGSNCKVGTLNSFGWQACKSGIKGVELKADKIFNLIQRKFDMDDRKERGTFWKWQGSLKRMIGLFKANTMFQVPKPHEVEMLAEDMGIELPDLQGNKYYQTLSEVYIESLANKLIMDFDDQIFMPIYLGLEVPRFDLLYIDELQDLNPVQIDLILKASDRLIGFGDRRQAIYGFRGADVKAMDTFTSRTKATRLPLDICYRCPKSVVRLAQTIIGAEYIQPAPNAPEGKIENVKLDFFRKNAQEGHYVLCRCTSPLVSECLRFIREGRRATVKGRDIGVALSDLIDKISRSNDYVTDVKFLELLNAYYLEKLGQLEKTNRETEIVALNDKVDTLQVLAESCKDVYAIKARIKQIFPDDKNLVGIILSTVHKAKGLESTTIWILAPELMPHPAAVKEWQIQQEMNLKYVAITRVVWNKDCEGALFFVSSK